MDVNIAGEHISNQNKFLAWLSGTPLIPPSIERRVPVDSSGIGGVHSVSKETHQKSLASPVTHGQGQVTLAGLYFITRI